MCHTPHTYTFISHFKSISVLTLLTETRIAKCLVGKPWTLTKQKQSCHQKVKSGHHDQSFLYVHSFVAAYQLFFYFRCCLFAPALQMQGTHQTRRHTFRIRVSWFMLQHVFLSHLQTCHRRACGLLLETLTWPSPQSWIEGSVGNTGFASLAPPQLHRLDPILSTELVKNLDVLTACDCKLG